LFLPLSKVLQTTSIPPRGKEPAQTNGHPGQWCEIEIDHIQDIIGANYVKACVIPWRRQYDIFEHLHNVERI
jgi:hypothetical protein